MISILPADHTQDQPFRRIQSRRHGITWSTPPPGLMRPTKNIRTPKRLCNRAQPPRATPIRALKLNPTRAHLRALHATDQVATTTTVLSGLALLEADQVATAIHPLLQDVCLMEPLSGIIHTASKYPEYF